MGAIEREIEPERIGGEEGGIPRFQDFAAIPGVKVSVN
jgi:hypothetical protein